jgi:tRNA (guanine-N7-)-methyltransferase
MDQIPGADSKWAVTVVELVPESYVELLDLKKTFGRAAPLEVDLGCGDGTFLCALAERRPQHNFLGIERLAARARRACRKAERLSNVRVLHLETNYAINYLLPKNSVEVFYLLFPDPWPKRRHHRRRIVTCDFLNAISAALVENGALRIATDQLDYFEHIRRCTGSFSDFAVDENRCEELPVSGFEKRFKREGAPIYRLELRKISPVT